MKIGELFVELGAKGGDGLEKSLKNTKSGLNEAYSSSIALKAAIIGVAYGLQQMMSSSAKMGTDLNNFNALTGISVQRLQQWQYAARQVGISNEEVAGSFKAVQGSISNMLLGKGPIQGYDLVAQKVGLDETKLRDTEYVMKKLQEFARSVPQDVGNNMLKSFGLSEGMIAGMRRNAFTDDMFKKAPTYSDGQIKSLDKVNAAWANLGNKVEMAFGAFTAKNGLRMVKDIDLITTAVINLATALEKVATRFELFTKIGQSLQGMANVIQLVNETLDTVDKGEASSQNKMVKKINGEWFPGFSNSPLGKLLGAEPVLPENKPGAANVNKTNNTTINQNLHFQHDGKDAQKTGESVNKAARDAFRTSQAQAQVN